MSDPTPNQSYLLESNVDYKVELLGGAIPENLAHLPVLHAQDVVA